MVKVSAIVPASNAPPTLDRCLAAIRAAAEPPDDVVVVDEGDGPADARNRGAAQATGDVLVFVDADVLPHADAFVRVRRAFDERPGLAALFGSYDDSPGDEGTVSQFRNLLHHHVHQTGAGPATTFWAGLGAVRREVFESVGGFDADRYRVPSVEDIELGGRLVDAGHRIELDPGLQGTHLKRWSLGSMIETDFARRGVPWVELLLERGRGSAALNLSWRNRLSALASVLVAASLLRGRYRSAIAALGVLMALNRSFYGFLARRRGRIEAGIGVALHAIHHVTGVLSVPAGVVVHVLGRRREH